MCDNEYVLFIMYLIKNVLYRYKRYKIASCGNVTLTEDRKWPKKLVPSLPLLPVLAREVLPLRRYRRQMRECCSTVVRLSTLLFKKASTSDMRILVECLALVYISRNIAARVINMSTVYAAVPDVPRIKTEVVTFVTGRWEIKFSTCNKFAESCQEQRFLSLALMLISINVLVYLIHSVSYFLGTCCSVELHLENRFYNFRRWKWRMLLPAITA